MQRTPYDATIKVRYLFGLGLIALLSLGGFLLLQSVISQERTSAELVNLSGMQRTYSQRAALRAMEYATAPDAQQAQEKREQMLRDLHALRSTHFLLAYGGKKSGASQSEAVRAILFDVPFRLDERVLNFIDKLHHLSVLPRKELNVRHPLLQEGLNHAETLLPFLDRLVTQYQQEARQTLNALQHIEIAAFSSIILVLFLEAYLIFLPMERSIALKQRQLIRARQQAEISERIKSEFLANMSHEIRTPMNGVIGVLELLEHTELDERQRQYLQVMRQSTKQLLLIIDDILDFSEMEAGKMRYEQTAFNLYPLIEQVIERFTPRARRKAVQLALCYNLPPERHYRSDPKRLQQVLFKLVDNAIKFTEAGHVRILAEAQRGSGFDWLQIIVEDTGIGIAPEKLEQIFDDFSQADGSSTRSYGGTGLGLAISKHIIEGLGGHISVESVPNQGSRFIIHLILTHAGSTA